MDTNECTGLMESQQLWFKLSAGVKIDVKNPVMISFCAAIFNLLSVNIRKLLLEPELVSASQISECDDVHLRFCAAASQIEPECDDVHLRFCGAALASIYQERYKKMKSKTCNQIGKELTVLDWIRMTDKAILPESLKYKDEGGMYFPHFAFIPFIKSVDNCIREHANEVSFRRYGSKLVEVRK